jgi:glutathione S-transferase
VDEGFRILETRLAREPQTGRFCHGDLPGLADCCLIPQIFNAERFKVDLAPYPTLRRINEACALLPAFAAAHPARQPDAE